MESKSIISKTRIPKADYVINPYVGCTHACKYCYARFMKRFTGHKEEWGEFLDVKINGPELVPHNSKKYQDKYILLSSVTDPYLQFEKDYELTRNILKNLVRLKPEIGILTKSDLVLRDLDILKQFPNAEVGFSFSTLQEPLRRELEPYAGSIKQRVKALKTVHESLIKNFLFISPLLPEITDWKKIIEETRDFVDYYMFENLNVAGSVWGPVLEWLKHNHPLLEDEYRSIYFGGSSYWNEVQAEIMDYCKKNGLRYETYFHHSRSKE